MPIQLESAKRLQEKSPELQFVLAVASTIDIEEVKVQSEYYQNLNITYIQDNPYDVMAVCDAIITASGTATLETGLMGVPFTITHKIAPLSYAILRRMMTIDMVGLVNIVAEKKIVQEFIQNDAQPKLIAAEINRILSDDSYRQEMIKNLSEVKAKLGISGGSKIVAELAQAMLNES